MADATRPRYGEFPSLFRGLPPQQPVDLDDMRTWVAVVAEAVELADRLLGSKPSHPDIPDPPEQR